MTTKRITLAKPRFEIAVLGDAPRRYEFTDLPTALDHLAAIVRSIRYEEIQLLNCETQETLLAILCGEVLP